MEGFWIPTLIVLLLGLVLAAVEAAWMRHRARIDRARRREADALPGWAMPGTGTAAAVHEPALPEAPPGAGDGMAPAPVRLPAPARATAGLAQPVPAQARVDAVQARGEAERRASRASDLAA